jgi:hypothetical protein
MSRTKARVTQEYLTSREIAIKYNLSMTTIRVLREKGILKAVKILSQWRYPENDTHTALMHTGKF